MLLHVILTRKQESAFETKHARTLLSQRWDSGAEFYGFLIEVLSGKVPLRETPDAWDNLDERASLDLVRAFVYKDRQDYEMAEVLFNKAINGFDDLTWKSEIAISELEKVSAVFNDSPITIGSDKGADKTVNVSWSTRKDISESEIIDSSLLSELTDIEQLEYVLPEWRTLERVEQVSPPDPARTAFRMAGLGYWKSALRNCDKVRLVGGRQSARRLRICLLQAQLLRLSGCKNQSLAALQKLRDSTIDPWYRDLAYMLLGEVTVKSLSECARSYPHYQLTLYTALGLRSEAEEDVATALNYYRCAMDSSLTHCPEYVFSKARVTALR